MIFSRGRGKSDRRSDKAGRHVRGRPDESTKDDIEFEVDDDRAPDREYGPYDLAEAPRDQQERLDLGALRIPAIPGVEIQLQAGPQGQVQQIILLHGESRLQLGVFAAPRTEGIWDEVRATLRAGLAQGGGRPEEVKGPYGPELRGRMRDASGPTEVRHVGIDGPRWFVHGVFLGAAATDSDLAGPLGDVLRGLIVDRGTEARPVSEALPLRLPPEAAAQLAAAGEEPGAEPDGARPGTTARAAGARPTARGRGGTGRNGSGQGRSGPSGAGHPA